MRRLIISVLVGVFIANIGISVAQAALTTALMVAEAQSDHDEADRLIRDLQKICQAFNRPNPVNALDPADDNPVAALGNLGCLYCVPGLDNAAVTIQPGTTFSLVVLQSTRALWVWQGLDDLSPAHVSPLGARAPPAA